MHAKILLQKGTRISKLVEFLNFAEKKKKKKKTEPQNLWVHSKTRKPQKSQRLFSSKCKVHGLNLHWKNRPSSKKNLYYCCLCHGIRCRRNGKKCWCGNAFAVKRPKPLPERPLLRPCILLLCCSRRRSTITSVRQCWCSKSPFTSLFRVMTLRPWLITL